MVVLVDIEIYKAWPVTIAVRAAGSLFAERFVEGSALIDAGIPLLKELFALLICELIQIIRIVFPVFLNRFFQLTGSGFCFRNLCIDTVQFSCIIEISCINAALTEFISGGSKTGKLSQMCTDLLFRIVYFLCLFFT